MEVSNRLCNKEATVVQCSSLLSIAILARDSIPPRSEVEVVRVLCMRLLLVGVAHVEVWLMQRLVNELGVIRTIRSLLSSKCV